MLYCWRWLSGDTHLRSRRRSRLHQESVDQFQSGYHLGCEMAGLAFRCCVEDSFTVAREQRELPIGSRTAVTAVTKIDGKAQGRIWVRVIEEIDSCSIDGTAGATPLRAEVLLEAALGLCLNRINIVGPLQWHNRCGNERVGCRICRINMPGLISKRSGLEPVSTPPRAAWALHRYSMGRSRTD